MSAVLVQRLGFFVTAAAVLFIGAVVVGLV